MGRDAIAPLGMCAAIGLFFGVTKLADLHAQGWPWWLLIAALVLVTAAAGGLGWWMWRTLRRPTARQRLRDTSGLDDYTGRGAADKGVKLRESIAGRKGVEMRELAAAMGRVGRKVLWKSWEDVCLVFMGPRSNKTSAVAVPLVLQAPGAVIGTTNKPDLWMLTAALRALIGRVYVFDPSGIAYAPQEWWWDVLGSVENKATAEKLASQFVIAVSDKNNREIWGPGAKSLLATLFLAAACIGGSVREALRWLYTFSEEPVGILRAHGYDLMADKFITTLEGPTETRGGIYMTANEAVDFMSDEDILRWITPPHTWPASGPRPKGPIEELDLWQFVTPHPNGDYPTLYLLTQEGTGSAAPVVAAMVDRLFMIAKQTASALGGRLDPPLTIMLDEAANICPIAELPAYYSWVGSNGISVTTVLQSYPQGEGVWGKTGMETLYSASTLNIIGAGIKDVQFARQIETSIGEHLVTRRSDSTGPGGSSSSTSLVREPVMAAAEIINMSKRNALWHVSGHPPVLMDLMPWYQESDADDISTREKAAKAQVRESAIETLGPAHPIAAHLATRRALEAVPVGKEELAT